MEEFIKKHGTPEEFAIAIIKAIPEISIDEAVEAIRGYHKDLKAIQMQAVVKHEIAEEIEKQMKERQLVKIKVLSCKGDPYGEHLPTKILLQLGKETKWFIKTDEKQFSV